MIGGTEWMIIAGALVLLFGAPQVIKWAKSLGSAKKAFQDASDGKVDE